MLVDKAGGVGKGHCVLGFANWDKYCACYSKCSGKAIEQKTLNTDPMWRIELKEAKESNTLQGCCGK